MKDILNIWIQYVLSQKIELSDATNAFQCMDNAYSYTLFLRIPKVAIQHQFAYQVFTLPNDTTRQYFDLIPYTNGFIAQTGDIAIFGTGVGVAGHICMVIEDGNGLNFTSLDANWAGNSVVTKVTHTYKYLLGVLRPKVNVIFPPTTPDIITNPQQKVDLHSYGVKEVQAILSTLIAKDDLIKSLQTSPVVVTSDNTTNTSSGDPVVITESNQIPSSDDIQPTPSNSLWSKVKMFIDRLLKW